MLVFAVTEYVTDPFPVPLAPLVTDAQATSNVAVHWQLPDVLTVIVPVVPPAGTETCVGASV